MTRVPFTDVLSVRFAPPGPPATGLVCSRVTFRIGADVSNGEADALEDVARAALAADELPFWQALRAAKRRREWLMGRVAAKDAVRAHLLERWDARCGRQDVSLRTDERGRPVAGGDPLDRLGALPAVSIAHTDGVAVAAVCDGAGGIGIDVERTDRRRGDYARAAFDDEERARIDAGPEASRPERALRLFCAKEAAAKATGLGLMGSPLNLRVLRADAAIHHAVLQARGRLAEAAPRIRDDRFIAWIDLADGFVIALARPETGTGS